MLGAQGSQRAVRFDLSVMRNGGHGKHGTEEAGRVAGLVYFSRTKSGPLSTKPQDAV